MTLSNKGLFYATKGLEISNVSEPIAPLFTNGTQKLTDDASNSYPYVHNIQISL